MTFCGLVDVENRHAVDRRLVDVARGGIRDVVRADDQRDVGRRELGVDVVHVESCVYGTFASASSTFM